MRRQVLIGIVGVLVLYVIGIAAYHYLENWPWIDSVYFATATMTTVGYGDIAPKTEAGKLFTVLFLWGAVSMGLYLVFTLGQLGKDQVGQRVESLSQRIRSDNKKDEYGGGHA